MKRMLWLLIPLLTACAAAETHRCRSANAITEDEKQVLEQRVMEHEFIPGCVTEAINDSLEHCARSTAEDLSFEQWQAIYQRCQVE
ncbi:hypothetical protein SIN8267_01340 [Sinobacterium norvegicum]|uniref:Uncharacterized protein n=1 Tax=Sinobacterium norvegicum TaxID=1641715 RepID=A0ABN8EI03_9GAMM|nr:hypothetical protein [Sinobacterium norvegicum]CAH0991238.1 hypothetical protein SIN8267_01340 [Sinobacterium norvegicum]